MKRVAVAGLILVGMLSGCATTSNAGKYASVNPEDWKNDPKVAIALGYLDTVWSQGKPVEGYAKYVDLTKYVHHPDKVGTTNPEGLAKFRANYPDFRYHVGQVFVHGDYVITHSTVTGTPGIGKLIENPQPGVKPEPKVGDEVIDIFLIKNGKIVEQWDTLQEIGGSLDGLM